MPEALIKRPPFFESDHKSALDAISHAQFIAFAPYVFQASVLLRDCNILREVEQSRNEGISLEEIAPKIDLSLYAVRVLLEAGLGIGLVYKKNEKFFLTKTGHFFLNDPMTSINTDFMRDVCYDGAQDLKASLEQGKPVGLRHLGKWSTIYEGLSVLPEPARTSWFRFDHYYSDNTFPAALPIVFENKPKKVMDIGANTGRFTLACMEYDQDVEVGLVDLEIQLDVARKNIDEAGFSNRVKYFPINVLDETQELPKGFDVIWMSQFLDCFADTEIVSILKKCHKALGNEGSIFINESFWDRQKFQASAFSLQMTSLYFTTMANGNSQMYDSKIFVKLVNEAGFEVVKKMDEIGLSHTILELKKK